MAGKPAESAGRRAGPMLLAFAGLALVGGCGTVQKGWERFTPSPDAIRSRGWTQTEKVDTEPSVFCYRTRAQANCYREQLIAERDRLIDKDAPEPEPGRRIVTGQRSPAAGMRRLPPAEQEAPPPQPGGVRSAPLPAPESSAAPAAPAPEPAPVAAKPQPKPTDAGNAPSLGGVAGALDGLGEYRLTEDGSLVLPAAGVFPSGSAQLTEQARSRLQELARRLKKLTQELPDDTDWRLRVTGHTDRQPIRTERFPSNWALSAARAETVADLLAEAGIPRDRIVPAGFGAAQPVTPGETAAERAANRRIELSLVAPQALAEASPDS